MTREHSRRMASSCKDHASSTSVDPGCRQCDKHPRAGDVFDEEAVQLSEHVEERHATAQVCGRFGVDAVRDQRGTDAVAGNIADEQTEVLVVQRIYQGEVAADGVHGMIEGVNAHGVPDQRSGCEAVLDARSEAEIFLDFHLALPKLHIGGAKFLLDAHLLGDVRECYDPKIAPGILEPPGTDNDGQPATALSRENKSISVVTGSERNVNLLPQKIHLLGGIEARRVKTNQVLPRNTRHF